MSNKDYERRYEEIRAFSNRMVYLRMRQRGDWFAHADGVDLLRDGLVGTLFGNGPTPAAAMLDLWQKMTAQEEPGDLIVVDIFGPNTRKFRWTGTTFELVAADPSPGASEAGRKK